MEHSNQFQSFDPATGAVLWQGDAATLDEIDRAVQVAKKALTDWSQLTFDQRHHYLQAFVAELKQNQVAFATVISRETGKPLWEAKMEVNSVINKLPISVQAYQERTGEKQHESAGVKNLIRHRPIGILAVLGPYNFPAHLPNGHIMPALLAGNVVLFKPSELTPLVAETMIHYWQRAGLPEGVLQLIQGGVAVAQKLALHSGIQGVLFTGSYRSGLWLSQQLAMHPQKILALEMGGNNPLIVAAVNHVDAAVYQIIQSAFITSGQRCSCARRLILLDNQEGHAILNRLISVTKSLKIAAYTDNPEPFMGPVISPQVAKNLLIVQNNLMSQGAVVHLLMEHLDEQTGFVSPAILDVTPIPIEARMDEEWFGPLLQVYFARDMEQALVEANRTRYGLAAGLLSDDVLLFNYFEQHIAAGLINWNRPLTGASSEAPFGGIGCSGNHRPSAYYAADYCAYPVASLLSHQIELPELLAPGIKL